MTDAKFSAFPFCLFFLFPFLLFAQNKNITLEDIWSGRLQPTRLSSFQSLNNGKEYILINAGKTLDVYDYNTGTRQRTLVDVSDIDGVDTIESYAFSEDESKVILGTQLSPIYRHSRIGLYFVYDLKEQKIREIVNAAIQEPTFSPDGSQVAYVQKNNIYIKNLDSGTVTQVTTDGAFNQVINGITDWVYEEEFAFVRAFDWNAEGTHLAYIRFDETEVPEFSMDTYQRDLYPSQYRFKYPKAGEKNSNVALFVYSVKEASAKEIELPLKDDFYIPRMKWTQDPNQLSVQLLNRHQNEFTILSVDAKTGNSKTLYEEKDKAYVDITDHLTFLEDNSFLLTSEKDGYNHIYQYSAEGKEKKQITEGSWDVTAFYGYDPRSKRVFYQSVEPSSIERHIYSIQVNGKGKKKLTEEPGVHEANFTSDFTTFLHTFSSHTQPPVYTLDDSKSGETIRTLEDNTAYKKKIENFDLSPKEFATIKINGNDLNMWMIKPKDFDESKSYPLLMFQYSGPGSQMVKNSWFSTNDFWHELLAQKGYIIACVDGRGTGGKGSVFKKETQNNLGKFEVEDQIEAARQLGKRSYIDSQRIGIWGWSYGGFMSSNCLFKGNDVFSMAIAVAPVTNWRFYDTIYTERYLTTPQENASGYDDNSPINYVDRLKGKFLLVHGSADDNVHVQNTMQMIEALVQANKQFDWAIYPDRNHGIFGGNTRLHLFTKMTNFVEENL